MSTNYENRVVFYFDILGFKDLIEINQNQHGSECTQIFEIFEFINQFYQDEIDERYSASKEITFFSDSVIISFVENEPDQIFKTIADIQILLLNLVTKGIVMRGAISYGQLFHNEKYIFGPAFVDAYKLESKKAKYPRIIFDESIILLCLKDKPLHSAKQDFVVFKEIIKLDNDDFWYIDYFDGIESLFNDNIEHIDYLICLQALIVENINKACCEKVKEKYLWMKEKYNLVVENIIANDKAGKISDYEITTLIKNLKIIDDK